MQLTVIVLLTFHLVTKHPLSHAVNIHRLWLILSEGTPKKIRDEEERYASCIW
jgi:hypothetical protein